MWKISREMERGAEPQVAEEVKAGMFHLEDQNRCGRLLFQCEYLGSLIMEGQ